MAALVDHMREASDRGAGPNDLVIDLPDEEYAEVEQHARARGLSVEEYAREAIRMYLGLSPARRGVDRGPDL